MAPPDNKGRGLTLVETVRWVIQTLVRMAQQQDWGEIRIGVQRGRIEVVHLATSYRDRLPEGQPEDPRTISRVADTVMQQLGKPVQA